MTELMLPPLLNSIEVEKPFETAIERVRIQQAGAGDLFWTQSQTRANFAIVLEPEVDQKKAMEMVPLALVALSDCLAALLPPQVGVQFRDEQIITVNSGVVGRVNAAIAKNENTPEVPDWLVLEIDIEIRRHSGAEDPGLKPEITTLDEEGWEEPDLSIFIETYARHFLSWMAAWDDDGYNQVTRAWKFKAENQREPDMTAISNIFQLVENGTQK